MNKRLLKCAEFVKGDFLCDIGTDHAYLPVYLVQKGVCKRALACDIAKGPLQSAKSNISLAGLQDEIQTVLSNGLQSVDLQGVTDVVIAGMGGELIAEILSFKKELFGINFVLQPNSKAPELRRFLAKNGFEILQETAVQDGDFCYLVINAKCGSTPYELSETEAVLGKLELKTADEKAYAYEQATRLQTASAGLKKSGNAENLALAEKYTSLANEILKRIGE